MRGVEDPHVSNFLKGLKLGCPDSASKRVFGISAAALRKKLGLTQREVAKSLGVGHMVVSRWERGEYSPNLQNIRALGKLLNIPGLDEPKKSPVNLAQEGEVPIEVGQVWVAKGPEVYGQYRAWAQVVIKEGPTEGGLYSYAPLSEPDFTPVFVTAGALRASRTLVEAAPVVTPASAREILTHSSPRIRTKPKPVRVPTLQLVVRTGSRARILRPFAPVRDPLVFRESDGLWVMRGLVLAGDGTYEIEVPLRDIISASEETI